MSCNEVHSLFGDKYIYDVQALNTNAGFVGIGLQMHQAARLGARQVFGSDGQRIVNLALGEAVGNRGEIVDDYFYLSMINYMSFFAQ